MLLSFIVDLKIRDDDRVQILEFGPLQHAGFSGFAHVTGKDMREDIVYPFIEENWHGPIIKKEKLDSLLNLVGQDMNESLGRAAMNKAAEEDSLDNSALIIQPFGYFVTGASIFQSRYAPGYEYMNGSSGFMMMNQNKVFLDYAIHSYGRDKLPVMPNQTSMVRRYSESAVEEVLMQEVPAAEYVIKTPDTAQGRGTMVVARDEMSAVIKGICRKSARGDSPLPVSSTWNHAAPVLTIQEKVNSRPTPHNGKDYDGTMRVAMTVWVDEKAQIRHEVHDAYWKMPRNAIGEGDYQDQVISCSPHYDRLSDVFARHAGSPDTFAAVSDADKDLVFPQLAEFLPDFVMRIAVLRPREDFVKPALENGEEMDVALAAMTYADMHYDGFDTREEQSYKMQMFLTDRATGKQSEPFTLFELPKPFIDKETGDRFLEHCKERPRGPVASFFSALHKRTMMTNGYAVENVRSLSGEVRQMRRPACCKAGFQYVNGTKVTVRALQEEEFFASGEIMPQP